MRQPYLRRLIEGAVLIGLGALILILIPSQIQSIPGMETETSPSFLPTLLAILIMLMGGGLIAQGLFSTRQDTPPDLSRLVVFRVGLSMVLLIVYTILFPKLGFVVTSGLFVGIYAYLFGSRSVLKISISMVAVPVVIWLFFELLFRIPLPHGVLY
ncbi:MAG: tripartite tricarboxylate transporter TctB family protein [Spirochaetaceae bacterium]|nr:MAG: tripartite tricarboxylate transporter TctB family protein [Spirochaetaceae bacterium]